MHNIVFLDTATTDRDDLDLSSLEELGKITYHPLTGPGETADRLAEATIAITNKVVIDEAVLEQCPKLQLICVAATGVNCIDLEAAERRSVPVLNVSGYSTDSVTQHVFSMLLSLATSLHHYAPEAEQWAESPMFTRLDYPIFDLAGKTLGIVGLGNIGKNVAKVAQSQGMKVIAYARENAEESGGIERVSHDAFFAQADVISLHCPLTPDTENFINQETLSLCQPGTLLINTGRGPLIDEQAVAEALRTGQLGGAGLDVLSTEPPAADHPLLASDIPNLLITPHTAWASKESRQRLIEGVAENIKNFK
ncbi:D-2-hydroxyacid dehydrogenase [Verrucomicrobiaceae bacterium 5K15]|uniref:D-2-hydroxyacid dehydrogenase n=1 Tax=Oceaniferula flava TaxID=2800421 RepID=A0AAE2SE29_9BACT|nr:D-2-hydroxyacid dehydrogenase [Oceaniferula flavus]MBK1856054.1 D-2-hydroxyacid dehydrogenase [Oceaniferula flavus]MBM1137361.1 D-2-hydroxyacid dehydrogenase [Oceaniferula flavus]